ncbi:MAG: hypothetical protein H6613_20420 [Ignavibacteriales bacterium]|nr:hypothetical protein [Ignavibacteriales bacterium]
MNKKEILELTLENSEVVIDQLMNNNLLKDIPFVGNAFKIANIVKDFRDRIYITKLAKFIFALDEISENEKKKKK